MTTAGTHSSETTRQEHSTTKKRIAINHCSEIERLLQQIKIGAATLPSMKGLHSRRRREAHYTFLQHLIQRITNQRLYTDDIPTSPKRSTYSDIMLKESLYIAGLLVTIFFY